MSKQWTIRVTLSVTLSLLFLATNLHGRTNQSQMTGADNPFPLVKPESVGIESDRLKRVTDQIEKWLEEDEIVGAVVMVIKWHPGHSECTI